MMPGPSERAAHVLARLARELAATLDLGQATELVVSTACRLFRVRRSILYRLDEAPPALPCAVRRERIPRAREVR